MGSRSYFRSFTALSAAALMLIASFLSFAETASAQTRIISLGGDLNFGSVPLDTSAQRTLIISNLGDSALTVSNIDYPPVPTWGQASFQGTWSGTIPPGRSEYVPITFTPMASPIAGDTNDVELQGYLTVASDATAGANYAFMSGVGTWPPPSPSLNLDFGTVPLGQAQEMDLFLTNSGSTTVTVTNNSVANGFSFSFFQTRTIAPGTAYHFFAGFAPGTITNYQSTAVFTSDATAPVLILQTTNGYVTNSADGSLAFGVSGTGTYPAGVYNGLFMPTNNPAFENSGYFSSESFTNGKLRGAITLAGKRYPFSAQISPAATAAATIKREKLPDLNVFLQFGSANGFRGRGLSGTIDDGEWTAELTALPAPIVSSNARRFVPAGKFTFTVAGNTNSSVAGPASPGTGTIVIKPNDVTRASGILGDGAHFSQSTVLGTPNQIPFYDSLYGGRGAILGWIGFIYLPIRNQPPPPIQLPPIVTGFPPPNTNGPVAIPPVTLTNIPIIIVGDTNPSVVVAPLADAPIRILSLSSNQIPMQIIGTLHWFKPAGIDPNYPDGFSFQTTVNGSVP